MEESVTQEIIKKAIRTVSEMSPIGTDGKWLEDITVEAGPYIKEWDIERCYRWSEWPDREFHFLGTTNKDIGIDVVGIRRSDGEPIAKHETDKFASASSSSFWAERWLVTNGDNPLSSNARQANSMADSPIREVNIAIDLQQQQGSFTDEACPHCLPNPDGEARRQTRSCMQNEAVAQSVTILREHEMSRKRRSPTRRSAGRSFCLAEQARRGFLYESSKS